ncbi:Sterile alpha motif (SAM) domain-containing protein [Striga hermonthica]|uniref:Sterile alpha motif (SAM) domain-containing protein n=1 Tax=Striga hermonthica TaxID=68872 RepID=A0A9N7N3B0_STRHE|nr:Sterile alpha motif (SAM) domain-containing protein [Striga hermonthica]
MYADLVEAQANRSIKERMSGNSTAGSSRRRPTSGKRQREDDDKWEHDLFEGNGPQLSNPRIGVKDLRLKLQRKSVEQAIQNTRASAFSGARDLREKLSGNLYSHPIDSQPPSLIPKLVPDVNKPHRNTIAAISEIPARETKKISGLGSKKKTQQKVERVDSFLQSLGLEKYSVTFQAEEVDMTALVHMGEEDLKTMGIPMGPRKKILLALESKV